MTGLEKAVKIAIYLEKFLPNDMHIALTGGVLYKKGERKDIDFVVYSDTCHKEIDTQYLADIISKLDFTDVINYGRVIKCKCKVLNEPVDVDIIVPESMTGEYLEDEVSKKELPLGIPFL